MRWGSSTPSVMRAHTPPPTADSSALTLQRQKQLLPPILRWPLFICSARKVDRVCRSAPRSGACWQGNNGRGNNGQTRIVCSYGTTSCLLLVMSWALAGRKWQFFPLLFVSQHEDGFNEPVDVILHENPLWFPAYPVFVHFSFRSFQLPDWNLFFPLEITQLLISGLFVSFSVLLLYIM